MANIYAVKTGNWSDTTVWNTGALPTSADDVYSNTFTVTVDTSPNVKSLRNGTTTGVSEGGTFVLTNGITITSTDGFITGSTGVTGQPLILFSLASPAVASLIGRVVVNINAISSLPCISHTGTGRLNVTGNLESTNTGGSQSNSALYMTGVGSTYITGNVTSISGNVSSVIRVDYGGILSITGDVTGGFDSNRHGIDIRSSGLILNIVGAIIGRGGAGINANQATLTSATITGAIGSLTGTIGISGNQSDSCVWTFSGPFIHGSGGRVPYNGIIYWKFPAIVAPTYWQGRSNSLLSAVTLYTADAVGGNPAASNVRSGITYGPANELTGTCVVPNPNSVGYGVPVDNTTGTAVLSASAAKEACSKAIVPALIALG
jgi:hypothetical protein